MKGLKKFFRKLKKKLRPLVLIPIVLLALILTGGYFLFLNGDDDNETSGDTNSGSNNPPAVTEPGDEPEKTTPTTPKPEDDPTAGKEFTIDSDRDEKDYGIAQATGAIKTPATISMRIGAAPKQPVAVNWNIVCLLPDEGAKSTDDTFTVTPPVTRELKLPVADAVTCTATAQAQLTRPGKGRIKVFLLGVRRAGD